MRLVSFRKWLGKTGFARKVLGRPPDLSMFKEKPSTKFLIGMGIVGFSYVMAWPFITVLGAISLYISRPALFLVGSPIAYGLSHLVFLAGMAIAGKDSIQYLQALNHWLIHRLLNRVVISGE